VASDRVISVRTEPLTGTAGWSFTMSRQRAMAAELTDAIRHGGAHHRLAALAVLARELSPLALLALSTPWWVTIATGRFPLAMSPGLFLMCCSLLAVTRYWAMRRMVGVAPKPTADLWSLVASIPAAFVASGAVLWWRPFRRRSSGVERPLIWSALVLTLFTGAGLVGQASTERTSPVSVVFSVITLVVLWVIGLRSMVERSWERSGVRVRLDLPAQVDGHDAVVVDGSLEGLALQLSRSVPAPDVGQCIVIEVITSEGGLHVDGAVVFCHVSKGAVIAGVSLDHRGAVPRAWLGVLARGLSGEESRRRARPKLGAVASAGSARPTRSWHDRLLGAAAVAISLVVLAGLGMVLSGIEPHVIRSGSMAPTYEIGDVVLSERVLPSEVGVGEVVTRPPSAAWGESLTHRVTAISVQSDGYTVRTQGDANEVGERWSIAADVWLGRTVASIPMVGSMAVAVRSGVGSVAVLAAAVLLAWFAIRRPRTGSDDQVEVSDCQISTQRRHAGRSSGA